MQSFIRTNACNLFIRIIFTIRISLAFVFLAKLSIESVGYGLIRIKGIEANRYICFNPINAELIVQVFFPFSVFRFPFSVFEPEYN